MKLIKDKMGTFLMTWNLSHFGSGLFHFRGTIQPLVLGRFGPFSAHCRTLFRCINTLSKAQALPALVPYFYILLVSPPSTLTKHNHTIPFYTSTLVSINRPYLTPNRTSFSETTLSVYPTLRAYLYIHQCTSICSYVPTFFSGMQIKCLGSHK